MSNRKIRAGGKTSAGGTKRNAVARIRSGGRGGSRLFWIGAVVAIVVLAAVVAVTAIESAGKRHTDTAATELTNPPATTAVGRDAAPPWPAPTDALAAVRAAGLPMLAQEGNVEHIHAHLDVRVDGQPIEVPAFLGIDRARGTISPLHTHDNTGVVHIESPVQRQFTLGELFSEWDVSLSADNIGALRNTGDKTLRVYVNGVLQPGNPAAVAFGAHDEIALIYGGPGDPVPAHYDFPAGE